MRYNPVQFIVWILVLIFVSFFVAFVCAPLYVIVYCLSGCIASLSVVLRDDQTFDIGQKISKDLLEKLGIKSNDLISNAYLDLACWPKINGIEKYLKKKDMLPTNQEFIP